MIGTITGCLAGLLLGARHAFEPDHLAAVSTLSVDSRSALRTALLGAFWGLGHTLALAILAGGLVVTRRHLPPRIESCFEVGVAVLLLILGGLAIRRSLRDGGAGPLKFHEHGVVRHVHCTQGRHIHVGRWVLARRPLVIGFVHGLAGSGSLTAMALAGLPTTASRLAYVVLFGFGSLLGMSVLSGLLGLPLAHATRAATMTRALGLLAGVGSASMGVYWGITAVRQLIVG